MLRLIDYWHSLSRETREGGDLHWRLRHWCRRPCTRRHALKASAAFNISSEASCINDKRPSHYDQVPHYWCLLYYLLEIESKMQTCIIKAEIQLVYCVLSLSIYICIYSRTKAKTTSHSSYCKPIRNSKLQSKKICAHVPTFYMFPKLIIVLFMTQNWQPLQPQAYNRIYPQGVHNMQH